MSNANEAAVSYLTISPSPVTGPEYVPPGWLEYIYFSIHLLIFLASLIGNSLALLSLISSASQFYVWFFNLVTADLLKTCICMPYSLYLIWNYQDYRKVAPDSLLVYPPFCKEEGVIFLVCMLVSLMSNMAIAVDRVIAISAPIFYANIQKQIKPPIIFITTWIFGIAVAIAPAIREDGYVYNAFVPNCSLELHNLLHKYMGVEEIKIVVGILYSLLFGLPILVVCISCAVVTYKLFKQTTIPSEDSMQRKNLGKSLTKTEVILSPEGVDSKEERSFVACDKLEMLHRQSPARPMKKQASLLRRQKLQKKAGLTMTLVAGSFFLCHVCLFTYWAFYDSGIYFSCVTLGKKSENWSYGACVTFHTALITMVYINSPLNVIIYYYRCSYLRQRMQDFFNVLLNLICFPCMFVRKRMRNLP